MNCQWCQRTLPALTVHHLIPRHKLRGKFFLENLNTSEKLRDHPQMAKSIAWVQKQDSNRKVRSLRPSR